jgi:hypothetical protein
VNKSELIDQIALDAEISKAAAGRALDAAISAVKQALKKGIASPWLVWNLSTWASVPREQGEIQEPELRSRSSRQKFRNSGLAKR